MQSHNHVKIVLLQDFTQKFLVRRASIEDCLVKHSDSPAQITIAPLNMTHPIRQDVKTPALMDDWIWTSSTTHF